MKRDPRMVVLDHISLGVRDLQRSAAFYDAVLATLGITKATSTVDFIGYERGGMDDFYIHHDDGAFRPSFKAHLAFLAPDRPSVDRFHAVAIEVGGVDDGAPGLRPRYHANYYAAFVVDPDGYRIEAVCHEPHHAE